MFLIFAGDNYYPEGGWNDFIGSYATLENAKQSIVRHIEEIVAADKWFRGVDWIHIVSCETMSIVTKAFVELNSDRKYVVMFKDVNK